MTNSKQTLVRILECKTHLLSVLHRTGSFASGQRAWILASCIVLLALSCVCPELAFAAEPRTPIDFEKSVAPILAKNCVGCHNPIDPKGELDLTQRAGMTKGGKTGPAIVPGGADDSLLIERVTDGSMPPPKKGQRLAKAEIEALSAWVAAGANWPANRTLSAFEFTTDRRAGFDWWSLQPVTRPAVPEVRQQAWLRNAIDAFVLRTLEKRGLTPAPETDRATFLRRAKFDLLGLPPEPGEIDAFVNDRSLDAFVKLIDRLLASPHYGERWGRHWLDVVRYGESDGFENDKFRDHAWPYRDFVIQSFNADKPYPLFIQQQLAGDVLQPITRDGVIGSGFLVAGPWDEVQNVGKSKLERMRTHEEQIEELIGAVSQTFLGMTVNCARCHDHKFDPIPQTDYYRLKAVFDGVDHGNRPILTPEEQRAHEAALAPIQARIKELQSRLDELKSRGPADAVFGSADPKSLLVDGRFGQALVPRRAQVQTPSKPAFTTPPLTVECWARLESKSQFNILVANHPKESGEHWELYTYTQSGEFSAYLPGYTPAEIRSGVDITDGKWHYVAMLFDGSRVQLFVDGARAKETAVTRTKMDARAGPLYFGSYPPQNISCDGAVDEVRISRSLRTIDKIPDAPFTADEQTAGLWHFDSIEGQRFLDAARIANERIANGAPQQDNRQQQDKLLEEIKRQQAELALHPVPLTYSGTRRQPGPTVVFLRGEIEKPGPQVVPGALSPVRSPSSELGLAENSPEAERRIKFSEWVASPANPLTARVMVNRIWQHHFGQGLVEAPNDLGFNGGLPSHPELLDWLAAEFMAPAVAAGKETPGPRAWSVKHMHRLIMLSAAYRQASQFNAQAAAMDADNQLLWRFSPHRLEAETIRDAMLAVSGELNPQVGGPSFRPFTITIFLTYFYHLVDKDTPEFNRRTVYRMNINTGRSPLLDALDCPAPSIAAPKRRNTTTPLQALALMNDSFVVRQANRFAERVRKTSGDGQAAQIEFAYRLAFGRRPTPGETEAARKLHADHGLDSVCWALLNASEFLYVK